MWKIWFFILIWKFRLVGKLCRMFCFILYDFCYFKVFGERGTYKVERVIWFRILFKFVLDFYFLVFVKEYIMRNVDEL